VRAGDDDALGGTGGRGGAARLPLVLVGERGGFAMADSKTFEDFVRGPSNEKALREAQAFAARLLNNGVPGVLVLTARSGRGKSLLLSAIETAALGQLGRAQVMTMTGESLYDRFLAVTRAAGRKEWHTELANLRLLVVDQAERLQGCNFLQEEVGLLLKWLACKGVAVALASSADLKVLVSQLANEGILHSATIRRPEPSAILTVRERVSEGRISRTRLRAIAQLAGELPAAIGACRRISAHAELVGKAPVQSLYWAPNGSWGPSTR
jgi:chromosomal replication initiation ATPase DnaA